MARVPEVLIVDQDAQGRYEVKQLVKQAQLGFAGEAGFGTQAVSLATETKPDVIFCAMSTPPERSLRTIEALLDVLPETPVIAYAQKEDVEAVRQTMLAGARDFLLIPTTPNRLLESVRSVLESEERKRLRLSGQSKGLGPKGLVVSVFGAKGGVGKTTIATNLGVALASKFGQSVAIIDADNSFGDVAATLELRPEAGIVDLIKDLESIDRDRLTGYLSRHSSGLSVLCAPRQSLRWREVTPDRLRRAIEMLARQFDIVLIDTASNLSDLSLAVLDAAGMVLWVTSSDFSSINNSLLGLEALEQMQYPDARIRLILNVTSADDSVRPSKIEEVLKRTFFWTVPYDKQIRAGAQIGNPAVLSAPESAGSRAISALAQAMTGGASNPEQPQSKAKRSWLFGRRAEESEKEPVTEGG